MNEENIENKIKEINLSAIKDVIVDFVFPIIGLGITAALFFVYIKPTYAKVNELKQQVTEQTAVLEVLNTKAAALTKMKDFNTVLEENAGLVERLYVSESNVPQLLDQVHQIATNAGMSVDRLNYSYSGATTGANADATSDQRKEDISGVVNVAATITGSYEQMVVFMQEIEKAARIAYVTTFRFGKDSNISADTLINVNVNVDSPYMYVQSIAVTDDPITLDITSPAFVEFMNSVKDYKYYEFLNPDIVTTEEVETTEVAAPAVETTEQPVVEQPDEPETPFDL
jgi:Tfp pilus assembly protein PilO